MNRERLGGFPRPEQRLFPARFLSSILGRAVDWYRWHPPPSPGPMELSWRPLCQRRKGDVSAFFLLRQNGESERWRDVLGMGQVCLNQQTVATFKGPKEGTGRGAIVCLCNMRQQSKTRPHGPLRPILPEGLGVPETVAGWVVKLDDTFLPQTLPHGLIGGLPIGLWI